MRFCVRSGFLLLVFFLPAAFAQHGLLLVAQKGDRSLAIVDPVEGKVLASVPENGNTGHEVTASPDGRYAYVPIYGNSGVGKPGTDGTNMVVIDLANRKIVGNVDFGHGVRPHDPVIGPRPARQSKACGRLSPDRADVARSAVFRHGHPGAHQHERSQPAGSGQVARIERSVIRV